MAEVRETLKVAQLPQTISELSRATPKLVELCNSLEWIEFRKPQRVIPGYSIKINSMSRVLWFKGECIRVGRNQIVTFTRREIWKKPQWSINLGFLFFKSNFHRNVRWALNHQTSARIFFSLFKEWEMLGVLMNLHCKLSGSNLTTKKTPTPTATIKQRHIRRKKLICIR